MGSYRQVILSVCLRGACYIQTGSCLLVSTSQENSSELCDLLVRSTSCSGLRRTLNASHIQWPPITAQGATALAETTGKEETWRWRVFSIGSMAGLIWGVPLYRCTFAHRCHDEPAYSDPEDPLDRFYAEY